MATTTARINRTGKHFEIQVDLESAMKYRKGDDSISVNSFLETDTIFTDLKKGNRAGDDELEAAFGTTDATEIAKKIVREGEVQLTQEYRDEERARKIKQVVDFLARHAMDPKTGMPHTPERISSAIEEVGINLKNVPLEDQVQDIITQLSGALPIKLATKRVKVTIPAQHTGRAYGVIAPYKEKEEWENNGDLVVTVKVPAGLIMEFYDKLNGTTHGAAHTEELKEE